MSRDAEPRAATETKRLLPCELVSPAKVPNVYQLPLFLDYRLKDSYRKPAVSLY